MKKRSSPPASAAHVTLFGRFALDRDARVLYAEGSALPVNERAMAVLITLVDAAGKIVSIEQFQQRLRPASSVMAHSVHALVSQLRRALGDDRGMIETVPRRGYRFAAEWYDIRDRLGTADNEPPAADADADADADTEPDRQQAGDRDAWPDRGPDLEGARKLLIGRDAELSELSMRIAQHRLVTLMGAHGNGKTRLAHETALRVAALFPDGIVRVELAGLTLPEGVPDAIAAQLPPHPHVKPAAQGLDGLIARLAGRRMLLIVDDCDPLAHEVGVLIDALLTATDVCVIVCAEAPLFIAGEYVLPLAPLRFALRPPNDVSPVMPDAPPSDACQLLAAQLDACGARFASDAAGTASNDTPAAHVQRHLESICRALSGNPLALDLAARQIAGASRGRTTPAEAVAAWDARWRRYILQRTGGHELALPPAALVPTVVAHAYHALDAGAQHVLRCASLFAAWFDVADVHAVSAEGDATRAPDDASAMQAIVSTLIDAGLLIEHASSDARRLFQIPAAVRRFTLGVPAHRPDQARAAARHAQRIAERLDAAGHRAGEPASRAPALADVRRAVGWSIEARHFHTAARLLRHSGSLWAAAHLTGEWTVWTGRVLDHDLSRSILKVRDLMQLQLTLAQAMQQATPAPLPADTIAAWWRVYELATACADDASRLHALSVLLLRTLEAGFSDDSPELLMRVRARIAQECEVSSSHRSFALLRGALLTLDGRHDEAIALLSPHDEPVREADCDADEAADAVDAVDAADAADAAEAAEAGAPDTCRPDYITSVADNALTISLWLTGAQAIAHPTLLHALQGARQQSDPLSRCAAAMMACVLFLLEGDAPRVAQQARLLVDVAQRNGLPGWRNIGRHFLMWVDATDETHEETGKLIQLALRNLARGHVSIIDLAILDRFAGAVLQLAGGPALNRLFEQTTANLPASGRRWLLPEALRVHAVVRHRAGVPADDVRALLDQATHEARRQRASLLERRISATVEQIVPSR
ncbi:ATP-binding protein [Burkholderia arboris]|uniref:ATP-binding protein n=1 Tax=Burkholderia arboris TaxID=488730 RepID=UPI001CF4E832|nr:winged helix-turn-helix domain-containing protein [Burkholderia arboris]MCA8489294.1 winged helix-turn-helix domain-containing protein [Burkholderia arboris]